MGRKMTERQKATTAHAATDEKPLSGRTVMITRARAQAAEFAAALEGYGARVVACPTIEIVAPESYAELDEAIENLFGYDWLVFTSANAVEHFLRRLAALGKEASELDSLRVCAVGDATAERLVAAHVHVDVVPRKFQAEGVFAALEDYLGGRGQFAGLNFLLPRAAVARDFLPRALEAAGARVDCVTFTSSSTVHNFAQLFDTRDLRGLLAGVRVACIGEVTARTAADYGLRADIIPPESTAAALARAVADFYSNRAG